MNPTTPSPEPPKPSCPPEGYENLPPEFLREHGEKQGMKWRNRHIGDHEKWTEWSGLVELRRVLDTTDFEFIAPLGTIAAALSTEQKGERCFLHPGHKEPCEKCDEEAGAWKQPDSAPIASQPQEEGREERPLSGEWRHSFGNLFCGTLRIAKTDYDTDPSNEFHAQLFDWLCKRLNAPVPSPSDTAAAREIAKLVGCVRVDGSYPCDEATIASILARHRAPDAFDAYVHDLREIGKLLGVPDGALPMQLPRFIGDAVRQLLYHAPDAEMVRILEHFSKGGGFGCDYLDEQTHDPDCRKRMADAALRRLKEEGGV